MWTHLKTWHKATIIFLSVGAILFSVLIGAFEVDNYFTVKSNVEALQHRAESGDTKWQFVLGYQHLTGGAESRTRGRIKKDNKKALHWLGSAARGGYYESYFYYAQALERDGQENTAVLWYRKSDHTGNKEAANRLTSLKAERNEEKK